MRAMIAEKVAKFRNGLGFFEMKPFSSTQKTLYSLRALLEKLTFSDPKSETLLSEKIAQVPVHMFSEEDRKYWQRLQGLLHLRAMWFGATDSSLKLHKNAYTFLYLAPEQSFEKKSIDPRDYFSSAQNASELLWNLYHCCVEEKWNLQTLAISLYEKYFDKAYDVTQAKIKITKMTDLIMSDQGLPYAVLQLLTHKNYSLAKEIMADLVSEDQEKWQTLYWLVELDWFLHGNEDRVVDFSSAVKYLYHTCFVAPQKAHFLEIDGRFFAEFQSMNELASEAFEYREVLLDNILDMWRYYGNQFDAVFQRVCESMMMQSGKIFSDVNAWEIFWQRHKKNDALDFLWVVEGNQSFLAGNYDQAIKAYQKALELSPWLVVAETNQLFCLAKQGKLKELNSFVSRLLQARHNSSVKLSCMHAYILAGQKDLAENLFQQLPSKESAAYALSIFCFEHKLFDLALSYALIAETDKATPSLYYHLSLCYNATGQKEEALKALDKTGIELDWLNYYRFTLERESGKVEQALKTLKTIPRSYFEDDEERHEAIRFAKKQSDFTLVKNLMKD